MSKFLQNKFEKNLLKVISQLEDASKLNEDLEKEIEESGHVVPSTPYVPIRNFEDFIDGMDSLLKRRLYDSDKFQVNVANIREALDSGAFVINVVAPGYKDYQELVDLIIQQALTPQLSSEDESIIKYSDNKDSQKMKEIEKKKAALQQARFDEMDDSIVSDENISSVLQITNPRLREDAISAICNRCFVGADIFNPDDPVNCLYPYVEDYRRDPFNNSPNAVDLNRRLTRIGGNPQSPRAENVLRFADDEGNVLPFTHTREDKIRHNVMLSDTSTAPEEKTEGVSLNAIYFDERAGFAHFRRDPKHESSYTYYDNCSESLNSENEAISRFNRLIDEGLPDDLTALQNKWFAFCYILSLIQESPIVSIFHPSGFLGNNPRPLELNPEKTPTAFASGETELPEELVSELINGFFAEIGVDNKVMSGEVVQAIMSASQHTASPVGFQPSKPPSEMNKQELDEAIEKIAEVAISENQKDDLDFDDFVEAWIEEKYPQFVNFKKKIQDKINQKLSKTASINKMKKEAVQKDVEASSLYKDIVEIITRHADNKKIGTKIPAGYGPEYVIDLLINYIVRKMRSSGGYDPKNAITLSKQLRTADFSFLIPFDKDKRASWGIANKDDFDEKIQIGTRLKISSQSYSEIVSVTQFHISDENAHPKQFPQEDDDSPTGLWVSFNPPVNNKYEAGKYSVSIAKPSDELNIDGVSDDIYDIVYGNKDIAKAKKIAHENAHIELNLSIYPCWAPAPYDYRSFSKEGIPHPNNAYRLKQSLEERLRLRGIIERRASRSAEERLRYMEAIKTLDQEIAEIKHILYGYVMNKFKSYKMTTDPDRRDLSGTLLRNYGLQNADDLYKEIRKRCIAQGFDIGKIGIFTATEVIKRVLSKDQYKQFLKIAAQVKKEFKNRRSVVILRGVDDGLDAPGSSNGLMSRSEGQAASGGSIVWSSSFAEFVSEAKKKIDEFSQTDPLKKEETIKSHIIIVSESQVPNLTGTNRVVNIHANTISKKEIEIIADYHINKIKNEKGIKNPKNVDVSKFTVFKTMILRMSKKLSGLGFSEINTFLEKVIRNLFEDYLSSGSLVGAFNANEAKINSEIDDMRNGWEANTQRILPAGSEILPARFALSDYVVKLRSEWFKWLDTTLRPAADIISTSNAKLDFFLRALETDCLFGAYEFQNDDSGKTPKCWVRFKFYENPPVGVPIVWFSSSKSDFINTKPDDSLEKLAQKAGFVITDNLKSALAKDAKSPSKKNAVYFSKRHPLVLADSPIDIVGNHLTKYKADLKASVEKIKRTIDDTTSSFKSILLLHGEPGTGKSIFAEVLASVFDCKFISTNFERVGMAGNSFYRGVAEENFRKFVDICRNSTDTVFLIDEIDKFLINATSQENGEAARALISHLLRAWENDEATYRMNNVHIVLTTNELRVIQQVSAPLISRIESSGGVHRIDLPADPDSLAFLFTGGSIYNNLMTKVFDGHEQLVDMAKKLIALYHSSNKSDQEIAKILAAKLKSQWPEVFSKSPLLPGKAKNDWIEEKGIADLVPKTNVDEVEDFVNGWKMINQFMDNLNKDVTVKVDGVPDSFNALNVICKNLSKKMYITHSRLKDENGKPRQFAQTTLREFIEMIRLMLTNHQAFLAGNERGIPFNYKTFLAVAEATVYSGYRISQEQAIREGVTPEEYLSEQARPSANGLKLLESFVSHISSEGKRLPREFLMTEEQYTEEVNRVSEYIKSSNVETDNDRGYSYLYTKIKDALYIDNPSVEKMMNDMFTLIDKLSIEGKDPFNKLSGLTKTIQTLREEIISITKSNLPPVQKLVALIKDSHSPLYVLIHDFRSFNSVVSFQAVAGSLSNRPEGKYGDLFYNFAKKVIALAGSLNIIIDIKSISKGALYESKLASVKASAKKIINEFRSEAEALRLDVLLGEITKSTAQSLYLKIKALEKKETQSVRDQEPFPVFGDGEEIEKTEESPEETPISPPTAPQQVKTLPPSDLHEYDIWAINNGLHIQKISIGDFVTVAHPNTNDHSTIYQVKDAKQIDKREENPNGLLLALSNGKHWEPKDLIVMGRGLSTQPQIQPQTKQVTPSIVKQPLKVEPEKPVKGKASPENPAPLGNIFESTTNYYSKIAFDIINRKYIEDNKKKIEKVSFRTNPNPETDPSLDDMFFSMDINSSMQLLKNKEKIIAMVEHGVYDESPSPILEIWNCF